MSVEQICYLPLLACKHTDYEEQDEEKTEAEDVVFKRGDGVGVVVAAAFVASNATVAFCG